MVKPDHLSLDSLMSRKGYTGEVRSSSQLVPHGCNHRGTTQYQHPLKQPQQGLLGFMHTMHF